jgi:uncharacterized protein VirK/YbjX
VTRAPSFRNEQTEVSGQPQEGWRERSDSVSAFAACIAAVRYLRHNGVRVAISKIWQAVLLLFSLRDHAVVVRVLSHPQSAQLARKYPLLTFKYLGRYVALGLPLRMRRSIFIAHFQSLQRRFNTTFLASLESLPVKLWRKTIGRHTFDVTLSLKYVIEHEGDLLLFFHMDGDVVYRLVFVFASGRDFHLPDETIILVSGVQGVPDFARVKSATRMCCDIQPAHILMAALGAIAGVTEVSTVLGLHQERQLFSPKVVFHYDRFFEIYGTEVPGQKIYKMAIPYVEKPLSEIKTSHRKRTLRKRQFKADTHHQVAEVIKQHLA